MLGPFALAAAVALAVTCLGVLRHAAKTFGSLRAVLESTSDGILVVSAGGRVVTYNRKFIDLWRIREPVLNSRDETLFLYAASQLRDPATFLGKVRDLCGDPEARIDDVLEFEDGRIYERHSEPQRLRGRTVGRVWAFHDVTEVRRSQANLEDAKNAAESATRA
jgi:PAS domain-containing protein